jgi:hypothetical protein
MRYNTDVSAVGGGLLPHVNIKCNLLEDAFTAPTNNLTSRLVEYNTYV